MAEKKPEFTVTDRRLFTPDGNLRDDAPENGEPAREQPAPAKEVAAAPPVPVGPSHSAGDEPALTPPTAEEQRVQAEAYSKSTSELDSRLRKELDPRQMQELEITFQNFIASLYMTALMQLGLAHEQGGGPRIDLIGARQTIDSISLLQQKTKGNLTEKEEAFLQNVLYELRMAYLEVTNALAHGPGPQMPGEAGPPRR